jgi:hypothetical protein
LFECTFPTVVVHTSVGKDRAEALRLKLKSQEEGKHSCVADRIIDIGNTSLVRSRIQIQVFHCSTH